MSEPVMRKDHYRLPSEFTPERIKAALLEGYERGKKSRMTMKAEASGMHPGKEDGGPRRAQKVVKTGVMVDGTSCGSAANSGDQAPSEPVDVENAMEKNNDGAGDDEEEGVDDNDEADADDDSYYESSAVFTDDNSEASSDNSGDEEEDQDGSDSASDDSGDVYVASEGGRWSLAGGYVYEKHSDEHVDAVRKELGLTEDWTTKIDTAKAALNDSETDSPIDPSLQSLNAELVNLRLRSELFDQSLTESQSLLIRYVQSQSELHAQIYVSDLHRRLVRSTQIELVNLKQSNMSLEEEMMGIRLERDQAIKEKKEAEGRMISAEKGQKGAEDKLAMIREAHDLERGMYLGKISGMQRDLDRREGTS